MNSVPSLLGLFIISGGGQWPHDHSFIKRYRWRYFVMPRWERKVSECDQYHIARRVHVMTTSVQLVGIALTQSPRGLTQEGRGQALPRALNARSDRINRDVKLTPNLFIRASVVDEKFDGLALVTG